MFNAKFQEWPTVGIMDYRGTGFAHESPGLGNKVRARVPLCYMTGGRIRQGLAYPVRPLDWASA